MFNAQALQDAARVAARELAVMPLEADFAGGFDAAMEDLRVTQQIFNPGCLVLNLDHFKDADGIIDEVGLTAFRDQMPVVNRALYPLMYIDLSGGRDLLRYPGALLMDTSGSTPACGTEPSTGFVVGIPEITGHNPETISWLQVIEEVRCDQNDWQTGPFNLSPPMSVANPMCIQNPPPPRGLVAIRLNYPFEAAAISSFQPNPPGPLEFEPNIDNPNFADEGAVVETNPEDRPGDTLPDDNGDPNRYGPYKGPYGLGRQLAFASTVRPYSRVLSGQAISRREVFLDQP
jgi:hypothetical protein